MISSSNLSGTPGITSINIFLLSPLFTVSIAFVKDKNRNLSVL